MPVAEWQFRLLLLIGLLFAVPAHAVDTTRVEAARLRFAVPVTWTRVPAGEDEAARYRLPAADGDMAESFVVLRTASGDDAVAADAQLELWYARFTQPDGRRTSTAASVLKRKLDDLRVTRTDVGGTYVAAPGAPLQAGVSGLSAARCGRRRRRRTVALRGDRTDGDGRRGTCGLRRVTPVARAPLVQ